MDVTSGVELSKNQVDKIYRIFLLVCIYLLKDSQNKSTNKDRIQVGLPEWCTCRYVQDLATVKQVVSIWHPPVVVDPWGWPPFQSHGS